MDILFLWLQRKNTILKYSIVYILIILMIASTATMTQMCDTCLNNSTCSIITDLESNITTTHCICAHGWLGPHCDSQATLVLISVTMTSATLQWDITHQSKNAKRYALMAGLNMQSDESEIMYSSHEYLHDGSSDNIFNSTQLVVNSFSIFYWTSNHRKQCNIVPNLTQNISTISGLVENTQYIFCANVDTTYTCDFSLVSRDEIGSACVYVMTNSKPSIPVGYVILVASVAGIGVLTLVLIAVVAKRNGFLPMLICAKDVKKSNFQQHDRTLPLYNLDSHHSVDEGLTDILLYNSNNANQKISIYPPNCPGKPKYQLKHKRMRGIASFTARNEQTIPLSTVLEYTTANDDDDDDDDDAGDSNIESDNDDNENNDAPYVDNNSGDE
ncbi:hypothetical protein ACF0H5_021987 [Mactra antiquata]